LTFSVAMWPAATLPVALVNASRRSSSGVPRRTQPSMNLGPTAKAGRPGRGRIVSSGQAALRLARGPPQIAVGARGGRLACLPPSAGPAAR